jgi:hypothetical protein
MDSAPALLDLNTSSAPLRDLSTYGTALQKNHSRASIRALRPYFSFGLSPILQ